MRILALISGALLLTASRLGAQEIFDELTDSPQVESTYIAGRFAHNYPSWKSRDNVHSMNLMGGYSSMYVYECYSTEAVSRAQKILKDYLKKHPEMELVMQKKSNYEDYRVYEQFGEDDKIYKMIIWNGGVTNNCDIVVINWKDGYSRNKDHSIIDEDIFNINDLNRIFGDFTRFRNLEGELNFSGVLKELDL